MKICERAKTYRQNRLIKKSAGLSKRFCQNFTWRLAHIQAQDQSHVEESNSDTISKANQSEVTVEDEDDQIDGSHLIDQSKKPVASSCGNPQFRGKLWYAVLPTLEILMTKC